MYLPAGLVTEVPHAAEIQAQQSQHEALGGVGLGRSHADLRPGVQVDSAVRLLRDRTAHDVADGQRRVAFAFHFAHRRQRVGRLAALRDRKHQRALVQRRIAVPQFAGVFDFDRQPRHVFDQVLAHQRGVPAGAAGGQQDPIDAAHVLGRQVQAAEHGRRIVRVQPAAHRVGQRLGLFENLLQHVVRKIADAEVGFGGLELMDVRANASLFAVAHPQPVGGDDRQLVIGQVDDLVRHADQRRRIAGDKMLALADADHQRAAQPGRDEHVGILAEHDRQPVGPFEPCERRFDGLAKHVRADRSGMDPPRQSCPGTSRSDAQPPRCPCPIEIDSPRFRAHPSASGSSRSRRCGPAPGLDRRPSAGGRSAASPARASPSGYVRCRCRQRGDAVPGRRPTRRFVRRSW